MSNVKIDKIPFNERYVRITLDNNILSGPMISNLRCLYEFIDKNSPGNSLWKYGNAYRMILKKARMLAGRNKYIISKRQIAALISSRNDGEYAKEVKIPYAVDYIFRAIFEIFDGYRNDSSVSVPNELVQLYNKIRRDVFYSVQSSQYEYKFMHNLLNDREELHDIRVSLLNDLRSKDCALGKKV